MKSGLQILICFLAIVFVQADYTNSTPADPGGIRTIEAPIGRLGYRIGTYLTVEGTRAEQWKAGIHTLQVDRVGTNLLAQAQIWIENIELPSGGRCILKGDESGGWVGLPPEVEQATGLLPPQVGWQFAFRFLGTSIEHYTTEFVSKVSDRDKAVLRVLYANVAKAKVVAGTCPLCSAKIRVSTAPAECELMCPTGCFRFVGNINPNSGTVVHSVSDLHEDKLNH